MGALAIFIGCCFVFIGVGVIAYKFWQWFDDLMNPPRGWHE